MSPKTFIDASARKIRITRLLKEEPFIGLNRMYPNYGDWLLKVCRRAGFKPRIIKEAYGAASALGVGSDSGFELGALTSCK